MAKEHTQKTREDQIRYLVGTIGQIHDLVFTGRGYHDLTEQQAKILTLCNLALINVWDIEMPEAKQP